MTMKLATCFIAGTCFAMLIAQAATPSTAHQIGRYQLEARGNLNECWVLDTTTGVVVKLAAQQAPMTFMQITAKGLASSEHLHDPSAPHNAFRPR